MKNRFRRYQHATRSLKLPEPVQVTVDSSQERFVLTKLVQCVSHRVFAVQHPGKRTAQVSWRHEVQDQSVNLSPTVYVPTMTFSGPTLSQIKISTALSSQHTLNIRFPLSTPSASAPYYTPLDKRTHPPPAPHPSATSQSSPSPT